MGLFSEGLTIGGNFAFQSGLGLTIKTLRKWRRCGLVLNFRSGGQWVEPGICRIIRIL